MPQVMKCHYEVLEVERNADDTTLKKQYRKLALKVAIYKYYIMSVKFFLYFSITQIKILMTQKAPKQHFRLATTPPLFLRQSFF